MVYSRLKSETEFKQYLAKFRWKRSFICPNCEGTEFWEGKNGTRICRKSKHQISPTSGTMMHRSHVPLAFWFKAIEVVVLDQYESNPSYKSAKVYRKNTKSLSKQMGLSSYPTAYYLLQKIRQSLALSRHETISGTIEVGYANIPFLKSSKKKLLIILSDNDQLRLAFTEPENFENELKVINRNSTVSHPQTIKLNTDQKIRTTFLSKEPITGGTQEKVRDDQLSKNCTKVFKQIKMVLTKVYLSGIKEHTLADYLLEFEFRYNNRSRSKKYRFEKALRHLLTQKNFTNKS